MLFSKWNVLTEEQKKEIGEPEFLQAHHLKDDHHIQHWERKDVDPSKISYETAVMIVISLILDQLPREEMMREIFRYQKLAPEHIFQFMLDLYQTTPWKELIGGA